MSKESVYDEQVAPLMTTILAICKEHKIAMIADFGLGDDLHCTSALLDDEYEPSTSQLSALVNLKPAEPFVMAETIETRPDGRQHITLRRVR